MNTPIAKMVAEMHSAGIPMETIIRSVATLEEAMAARAVSTGQVSSPVDTSMMEKRRAWDRERKRKQRALKVPDSQWWTLIGQVLQRDGHRCTYCESTQQLTADHVVPLTRGGTNDLSNLTACCIPCNTQKGNKFLSEWSGGQSARFHPTVRRNPPDDACIISKKEDVLSIEVEEKKESKKENTRARGTRCPPDFALDDDDRAFAASLGISPETVEAETPQFIDYWSSVAGAKGVKLNWKATWRNRMRDLKKYQPTKSRTFNGQRTANPRTTGHDAVLAAAAREARKIVGDGEMAGPAHEAEFSFGDGAFGSRSQGPFGKTDRASQGHNRREPGASDVLEGEIIPPDEDVARVSGGWRGH